MRYEINTGILKAISEALVKTDKTVSHIDRFESMVVRSWTDVVAGDHGLSKLVVTEYVEDDALLTTAVRLQQRGGAALNTTSKGKVVAPQLAKFFFGAVGYHLAEVVEMADRNGKTILIINQANIVVEATF